MKSNNEFKFKNSNYIKPNNISLEWEKTNYFIPCSMLNYNSKYYNDIKKNA